MFRNEEILKTVLPQIILQGPPGTSKTYEAKRLAARMIGLKPDEGIKKNGDFVNARYPKQINGGSWTIVQFHPAYNYEDFVRGIQVQTKDEHVTYETVNRILGKIARSALDEWNDAAHEAKKELGEEAENDSKIKEKAEEKAKKFVLIIDEINRANLAAVLGELIYALEYRGDAVDTPYRVKDKESNELIIPPNFYIIGTMNTADRSIGHIDYAVRRRFVFIPCLPDESVLDNYYEDTPLSNKAKKLFDLVANLFEYPENGYLSPDFYKDDVQVGHTYFIADSCEHLAMKFAYQVYPLLREYYKDGILVGGDVKINITEDTKDTEGLKFDIKTPEDSQKIYEEVQKWCKNNIEKKAEQSESASDSKKESDDNESSGDEKSEQTDKQPPADKQEDE